MASNLFDRLKEVFDSQDWSYTEVQGREVILAGFEGQYSSIKIHAQVFAEIGAISIVSESEQRTYSSNLRERLAELILRTNQTLTIGNFEMLWDEGQIIFRSSNLFPEGKGDSQIIAGMVLSTISEVDRLAPMIDTLFTAETCTDGELNALNIPLLMESDAEQLPKAPQQGND